MKKQFVRTTAALQTSLPTIFIADDATAADQIALGLVEILGKRVATADTDSFMSGAASEEVLRVINTGTRALSAENARARIQSLASLSGKRIPVVQIDSRLRGIGNALRGLYESLDFDFLLFVPAEPELNRLVQNGIACHVEEGRLIPFHESSLAKNAEPAFRTSQLREFLAAELNVPIEQMVEIPEKTVSQGADAIGESVNTQGRKKTIVIPDVTRPEHFAAIVSGIKSAGGRTLIAGSRTFLRSFFASYTDAQAATPKMKSLAQTIDRQKRGAPFAIISSLEPAMNAQMAYARQALGPHLVQVEFDSSLVSKDNQTLQQELDRVQQAVLTGLKAMRPVLLHTSRKQVSADAVFQQKQLDALSRIMADQKLNQHLTALFISGGQTAETLRKALGISSVEIKGAFQENIPWGVAVEGLFQAIPLVTKGGRMGRENVLFEFFEQGHSLPRANVLPVVTPMTQQKEVDEAGIEKLVAHLVRLGTTDIFAVGNAGEFRFLTNAQRLQALEIFARKAKGKLRVFAGITGDTAEETRKNYEAAGKLDVHAAVVMPLYFLKSSEEILPFVESLAPIQPKLPLILYNNAERTKGQHISFEAVEALQFPVVAIKDSSGDLDRLDRYVRTMPVYEGQQRQFIEGHQHAARGAVGIIGHITSLPNEFFAPATTASRREEIARQINELSKVAKQGGAEVAAYKYILSLSGVIGDTVASNEPVRELTDAQRELIRVNNAELISKLRVS